MGGGDLNMSVYFLFNNARDRKPTLTCDIVCATMFIGKSRGTPCSCPTRPGYGRSKRKRSVSFPTVVSPYCVMLTDLACHLRSRSMKRRRSSTSSAKRSKKNVNSKNSNDCRKNRRDGNGWKSWIGCTLPPLRPRAGRWEGRNWGKDRWRIICWGRNGWMRF